MKLIVNQRCEQGTPQGVMKFTSGEYAVTPSGEGFSVAHEPRDEKRKVDGVRKVVKVNQTVVAKAILDKLVAAGVATLEA